jgi:alpha-1,2-mannosyltransferase
VKAFALLLKQHPELARTRLVLIGGCRNEGDEQRVEALKALAKELDVLVSAAQTFALHTC